MTGSRRQCLPDRTRCANGFTLLELLSVSAVLGLLAALLLPTLAGARGQAGRGRCLAHVRQIVAAHLMYVEDWDGQLPPWWQPALTRPEPYRARRYWPEYFRQYLRGGASEVGPERRDAFTVQDASTHGFATLRDPSAAAWEPPVRGLRLADYALLTWGPGGAGMPYLPYWRHPGPLLALAQVARPAETMSVTDGVTTTEIIRAHTLRHGGGMVAGFLDGHGRWLDATRAFEVRRFAGSRYQEYAFRLMSADR
jgi:prepilin-type N-terminal cleavage/methylation domain-containing protein/prepilin-type processing-associated H-X9-DG protein